VKQKKVFLECEGDAWYARNASRVGERDLPDSDPLLLEILQLTTLDAGTKILEIGSGDGTRLSWLKQNRGFACYGVEPSRLAVDAARARGIDARQATADQLPFEDETFDVVMFGFCLYLCDRDDLFRIAAEADRVLKNPGWLLILDFYSPGPMKRAYRHRAGVFSHKMDYQTLFTWHPAYTALTQRVRHHSKGGYTDDPDEWIATSVLRKNLGDG
jgi:SAM-dependent methyltransferase